MAGAADQVRPVAAEGSPTLVIAETTTWADYPSLWGRLLAEVWDVIHADGVAAGRNVMCYLDDRPSVEVGAELLAPFAGRGRVMPSTLPTGRAAMTVERGAPTAGGIAAAHERVLAWCAEQRHPVSEVRWEIYSHHSDDPAAMHTEVYRLLR